MITMFEEELIEKNKWITSQDMLDLFIIAESTPGAIAVNVATSVGYRLRGVLGAILATLGVVLPSFVIICGLSFVIELVADNKWYQAAFKGVQACVVVLVFNAFVKMSKNISRDWFNIVLLLAAFGVATFTSFDIVFLILIGGALGLIYSLSAEAIANKKDANNLPLADREKIDEQADGTNKADEQNGEEINALPNEQSKGDEQ